MASAKSLILIAGSEAANIVRDTNCGIEIAPGNISNLCEAIKSLAVNPELRKEMGYLVKNKKKFYNNTYKKRVHPSSIYFAILNPF